MTSTTPHRSSAPSLEPDPRRWRTLALLALVQFMLVLDDTVVNVALPSIQQDLGFSRPNLAWVVNAYVLTFGGFLLLGGRLADVLGRRRVYLAGLSLFAIASLTSGLAQTEAMLVASRAGQGVGAALVSPAALSIIASLFPEPAERTKALGLWGGLAALGGTLGVVVSGVINDLASWRWIFLVNLPVAVMVLALVPRRVAAGRRRSGAGIDVLGALAVTSGIGAVIWGLLGSVEGAFSDADVVAALVGGALLLIAFVIIERQVAAPLVRLSFFRDRTRSTANLLGVTSAAAFFGLLFAFSLYMQEVLGYSPLEAGLAYIPSGLALGVGVAVSMQICQRLDIRIAAVAGLVIAGTGLLLLSRVPVDASYANDLLLPVLLIGLGNGLHFPVLTIGGVHRVAERELGLASAVQVTAQQVGGALGLAVLVAIASSETSRQLVDGAGDAAAATSGYTLAFAVAGGMLLAAAALAALGLERTRGEPPAPAPLASGGPERDGG